MATYRFQTVDVFAAAWEEGRALSLEAMFILLMGLSIIKAALIIAYFMHLRYGPRMSRAILLAGILMASLGTSILTTSHGVMTGREAVKAGVGGEVLCNVW